MKGKKRLQHYSGEETVLTNCMTFMETCKQKANESIAEFESRCKYLGSKCEYSKIENAEEELIWDRFVARILDNKLRAELLRHKRMMLLFSVFLKCMINKANAREPGTKTNTQVIESQHTEKQVNYTASSAASYNSKLNPNLDQNKTRSGSVQNKRNIPFGTLLLQYHM